MAATLILTPAQAEAVYSAMCALNNVNGRCVDLAIGDNAAVLVHATGTVTVIRYVTEPAERYASQHEFASAYGLNAGAAP
jgi:hypothetical protein